MHCTHCKKEINKDDIAYFPMGRRGHRNYVRLGVHCGDCIKELFDYYYFSGAICKTCDRPMQYEGVMPGYCSDKCRQTPATEWRKQKRIQERTAAIPDHFDCKRCGEQIAGVVVFDYEDTYCESCYVEQRTELDREMVARYGPGRFGYEQTIDPDSPDYDPLNIVPRFSSLETGVLQCQCGQLLRFGWRGSGYCCARCRHEGQTAERRVERVTKVCASCGDEFTPKRSDAKTCSDGCRQELHRRMKRKARRSG